MAKRFFNNTEDVVSEAIEGLVASHTHLLRLDGFPQVGNNREWMLAWH